MRKKILTLTTAGFIATAMSMTVFAGQWIEDNKGLKYQNDDGSFKVSEWYLDPNNGKYFYLDANGYRLVNAITPDGYRVIENGSWDGGAAVADAGSTAHNESSATTLESPFLFYNDVEIDTYDTEHQVEALKKLYRKCAEVIPGAYLWDYSDVNIAADLAKRGEKDMVENRFDINDSILGMHYHVRSVFSYEWSDQIAYGVSERYKYMEDIDYATLRILLGENESIKVYQLMKAYGDPKKVGGSIFVKTTVPSTYIDGINYSNTDLNGKYAKIGDSISNGDGTYDTVVYDSTALVGDGIVNFPTITGVTDYGRSYKMWMPQQSVIHLDVY